LCEVPLHHVIEGYIPRVVKVRVTVRVRIRVNVRDCVKNQSSILRFELGFEFVSRVRVGVGGRVRVASSSSSWCGSYPLVPETDLKTY
jgi:hypothetical protein